MRNIKKLGFGAAYIRGLAVVRTSAMHNAVPKQNTFIPLTYIRYSISPSLICSLHIYNFQFYIRGNFDCKTTNTSVPPQSHDDVMKWKHFPRYWPFARGIHRPPVDSPHKGQWRGVWCFLWSAPEQTVEQNIETPVIWDAIALIMTSL